MKRVTLPIIRESCELFSGNFGRPKKDGDFFVLFFIIITFVYHYQTTKNQKGKTHNSWLIMKKHNHKTGTQ